MESPDDRLEIGLEMEDDVKLISIIDNIMAELDNDTKQQANDIQRKQKAKHHLRLARNILAGTGPSTNSKSRTKPTVAADKPTVPAAPVTVAEAVERLLKEAPDHEMHVDQMLPALEARFGRHITRKNLTNTLNRWLVRGRKFTRTRPNTYALL